MANVPKKVVARLQQSIPDYKNILLKAQGRDINESDTVTIVTDMLSDVFGIDKYTEITREFGIQGSYCDLAVKIEGTVHYGEVMHGYTVYGPKDGNQLKSPRDASLPHIALFLIIIHYSLFIIHCFVIIWNQIIKRDVTENEATIEATRIVKKATRKATRKASKKQVEKTQVVEAVSTISENERELVT